MENYLLAVICCLLPFIIGGIWFAVHDTERMQLPEPEVIKSPIVPEVEDLMLKCYFYSDFDFNPFSSLLEKLKKVNLYDPKTRPFDHMDEWFKGATPKLMHDGKCLAYIDHYGYLEDTLWKNIKELNLQPQTDVKFQKILVSVHKTDWGIWIKNFNNLLFHYGELYELLPEIENIINSDSRFKYVRQTYNLAREYAGSYKP